MLYLGIALRAVLLAPDREQQQIRYQGFRDLLDLLRRGKHQCGMLLPECDTSTWSHQRAGCCHVATITPAYGCPLRSSTEETLRPGAQRFMVVDGPPQEAPVSLRALEPSTH